MKSLQPTLTSVILAGLLAACSASSPQDSFVSVAALTVPPGNPTVTLDGRLIVTVHPFAESEIRALEILPDNSTRPFPSQEWASQPDEADRGIHAAIGIRTDQNGVVWILDMGGKRTPPRLIGWNTKENRLHRVIVIPYPASRKQSFLQDFAIDPSHGKIFIADSGVRSLTGPSEPGIIIVDSETGFSRRVLHAHRLLQPEDNAEIVIDGKSPRVAVNSRHYQEPKIGLNPIAVDATGDWLYFGAMHGTSLYRVKTTDLLDEQLNEEELALRVEHLGFKPVSDGISIDNKGNVYVTDLNAKAIGVLSEDEPYRILIKDDLLQWPDGLGVGPDGFLYATVNQLHLLPALNKGKDETKLPFQIIKFRPLASGTLGR
jgi:sugar lactone lactonase YvrE